MAVYRLLSRADVNKCLQETKATNYLFMDRVLIIDFSL
jgi:hypothetical protein